MTIAFNCSACGTPLKVADTLAGKKCKCPKCAVVNAVPGEVEVGVEAAIAPEPSKIPKKKAVADPVDESAAAEEGESKKGKKGKGKKGSNKLLLIGGGVAVLCLGFLACGGCGGGFAIWYFWFGAFDDIRYMPNGTTNVHSQRIDQMRNSKIQKDMMGLTAFNDPTGTNMQYGLVNNNIDRITTGNSGTESITVLTTNSSVEAADISSKFKADFTETKVGSYKMMERKGADSAFCVVGRKTVIYGPTKTVRAVLERDKAPELSEAMQTALKKADFSNSSTSVMDFSKGGGMRFGGGKAPESTIAEVHYSSDILMRMTAIYKDSSDAAAAKKEAEDSLERLKALLKGADTKVKVWTSGNAVIVEWRFSPDANLKDFKFGM